MIWMLVVVGILFGAIFAWKGIVALGMKRYFASMGSIPVTVSTMSAQESSWQPQLKTVGSLRAKVGVSVTTELAGMVEAIYFKPGSNVKKGDILVQLNAAAEQGQLSSLKAQVELAKITFARDKAQFNVHAVSKQVVDTDEWSLKNLQAQADQQAATTEKKTIRAHFDGKVGINNVNPGQYLNVGDKVTTLQSLDPIYADFYVPQQALADLKLGQNVNVTSDTFPGKTFSGTITTIEPLVDLTTRNVLMEVTLQNPDFLLVPGMFVQGDVSIKSTEHYITLPQTAISYNPYGDIVYLIKDSGTKDKDGKAILIAHQVFVTVGQTRGDQVAVLKGIKANDVVVTSGQLKLKNGSPVVINNAIQPSNAPTPQVDER